MAENTRSATTIKEVEDRVVARLETRLIKLAGNIQKVLEDSLKDSLQELVKDTQEHNTPSLSSGLIPRGDHSLNLQYNCGTRLARIDFPIFNGKKVHQWIYQAENYFSIGHTPND